MISSEHDPSPGAPLGDWLAADLAAVDRSVTPWLLVGIHRPIVETEMYPSDYAVGAPTALYLSLPLSIGTLSPVPSSPTTAAGLRAILEPLLLRYSVDAVLAGHYHSFQRSCAMAALQCVPEGGIVHYTTGAAGAGLDGSDACCYNRCADRATPGWSNPAPLNPRCIRAARTSTAPSLASTATQLWTPPMRQRSA